MLYRELYKKQGQHTTCFSHYFNASCELSKLGKERVYLKIQGGEELAHQNHKQICFALGVQEKNKTGYAHIDADNSTIVLKTNELGGRGHQRMGRGEERTRREKRGQVLEQRC